MKRTTLWKKTGAVRELSFGWDVMGRRPSMADSHGRFTWYTYDRLSRPETITVCEPNPHSTSIANAYFAREYRFKWDNVGNLTQVDYLWDGHRPIEEWMEIGHGRGKKEKGELFTQGLGGDLLPAPPERNRTSPWPSRAAWSWCSCSGRARRPRYRARAGCSWSISWLWRGSPGWPPAHWWMLVDE